MNVITNHGCHTASPIGRIMNVPRGHSEHARFGHVFSSTNSLLALKGSSGPMMDAGHLEVEKELSSRGRSLPYMC